MGKVVNLHLLRAIATLIVVVAHSVIRVDSWAIFSTSTLTLLELLGRIAVDTFFVISGFIMVYTSADLFGGSAGVAEFARRRLIRIIPLYWIATATEVAIRSYRHNAPSLSDVLHTLFFIPYTAHPGALLRPVVGVGWTLNYEILFYLIFGLAIFLPRRIGIAAILSTIFTLVVVGCLEKSMSDTSLPTTVSAFLTDRIILMFGAGVIIALVFRNGPSEENLVRHPFAIAGVILAISVALLLNTEGNGYPSLGWDILMRITVVVCTSICLFGITAGQSLITRLLSLLGDASYSIYLFHFILIIGAEKIWVAVFQNQFSVVCVVFLATAATAGGTLIYMAVERPITRFFRKLQIRRPEGLQVAPAEARPVV